jgi:hypothetical protein
MSENHALAGERMRAEERVSQLTQTVTQLRSGLCWSRSPNAFKVVADDCMPVELDKKTQAAQQLRTQLTTLTREHKETTARLHEAQCAPFAFPEISLTNG